VKIYENFQGEIMKTTVTTSVGGKQITIETGRLAKQADGSALVTSGNSF
jgi:polyribonucleotide nucleotidyltransferase